MTNQATKELHNQMIEMHEPCLTITAGIMQEAHNNGLPRDVCMVEATKAAAHYLQSSMFATKNCISAEAYAAMKEHIINHLMAETKII